MPGPEHELEPADDADDPKEANLGQLDDHTWRAAHEDLAQLLVDDPDTDEGLVDLTYTWAPDRKAEALAELAAQDAQAQP